MTNCENCGRIIELNEIPNVYKDKTVCTGCHKKLTYTPTPWQKINRSNIWLWALALILLIFIWPVGLLLVGTLLVLWVIRRAKNFSNPSGIQVK